MSHEWRGTQGDHEDHSVDTMQLMGRKAVLVLVGVGVVEVVGSTVPVGVTVGV